MVTNVYAIFDKVADEMLVLGTAKTDGLFVRQNLPYVSKINENYLDDMEIFCIGSLSTSDMKLSPCEKRSVSWDSYRHPESFADVSRETLNFGVK